MKRKLTIGLFLLTILSVIGCSRSGNGELTREKVKEKWKERTPYGMAYIPRGSFNIGPSDEEITASNTPLKTVSVEAFWMDDTEITNNEYRQFVYWVRDSMARTLLIAQDSAFMVGRNYQGDPIINWKKKIKWNDPQYQQTMNLIFLRDSETFMGKREIDTRKLAYEYSWIDVQQAANRMNSYKYDLSKYNGNVKIYKTDSIVPITSRKSFFMKDTVFVYPDTLTWIRDFSYSYNEPLATHYFWHPGFDDYPVVGVTWEQAKAFCHWRSKLHNDFPARGQISPINDYRLPTEAEWEYAARGGKKSSMYPWGGYYTRDQEGEFLANFKPLRGNYVEDGGITTMKVGSYYMNEYCLFDMAGNVAEWTSNAYIESAYDYINDLNPNFEYNARKDAPTVMKRKVIRGGSWKDIAYFIQVSTRSYEYQDTAKSYIGFRCVRSTFKSINYK